MNRKITSVELDYVLGLVGACRVKRQIVVDLYNELGFNKAYKEIIEAAFSPSYNFLLKGATWHVFEVRGILYELMKRALQKKFGPSDQMGEAKYERFTTERVKLGKEVFRYVKKSFFLKAFPPQRVRHIILKVLA
jgi:hypothetical protein